jgi:hypothetical protein
MYTPMPETTIDYAAKIREIYPYANDIARAVGVGYPGSNTSVGAKWLLRIRDSIAERAEEIMSAVYPSDEIDYDSLEVSTYAQWEIFTDLQLWQYEADITYSEHAEFHSSNSGSTESVPAIRVSDIVDLAGRLMSEIAGAIGHMIVQELEARDEDA